MWSNLAWHFSFLSVFVCFAQASTTWEPFLETIYYVSSLRYQQAPPYDVFYFIYGSLSKIVYYSCYVH